MKCIDANDSNHALCLYLAIDTKMQTPQHPSAERFILTFKEDRMRNRSTGSTLVSTT